MIIIVEVLMRGVYSEREKKLKKGGVIQIEEPSGFSNCASGTLGHNSHVCCMQMD